MKQTFLLITLLLATFFAIGQAQQGFVKTKGRLDAQGKLIPGQGLKGATVSVQGRTAVLVKSLDISNSSLFFDLEFLKKMIRFANELFLNAN